MILAIIIGYIFFIIFWIVVLYNAYKEDNFPIILVSILFLALLIYSFYYSICHKYPAIIVFRNGTSIRCNNLLFDSSGYRCYKNENWSKIDIEEVEFVIMKKPIYVCGIKVR